MRLFLRSSFHRNRLWFDLGVLAIDERFGCNLFRFGFARSQLAFRFVSGWFVRIEDLVMCSGLWISRVSPFRIRGSIFWFSRDFWFCND